MEQVSEKVSKLSDWYVFKKKKNFKNQAEFVSELLFYYIRF